jgi:hypothetical protein
MSVFTGTGQSDKRWCRGLSYMTMSRLTYILGFSVNFFFQPIYTDYTN